MAMYIPEKDKLDFIRFLMQMCGFDVFPTDKVFIRERFKSSDCLKTEWNTFVYVNLAIGSGPETFGHELCHSQQNYNKPGYWLSDGSIDDELYETSRSEREARLIGWLYGYSVDWDLSQQEAGEIAEVAGRLWEKTNLCGSVKGVEGYWLSKLNPVDLLNRLKAFEEAWVSLDGWIEVQNLSSWINWLGAETIAHHPDKLPRRRRQAVNAVFAKYR